MRMGPQRRAGGLRHSCGFTTLQPPSSLRVPNLPVGCMPAIFQSVGPMALTEGRQPEPCESWWVWGLGGNVAPHPTLGHWPRQLWKSESQGVAG